MKSYALTILCGAVLCVILTLGLWPFHSPGNHVAWLEHRNGLRFSGHSTVISSRVSQSKSPADNVDLTVEVWLEPKRLSDSGTLLVLYSTQDRSQFSLLQSEGALELRTERQNDRAVHFYVPNAIRKIPPLFVAFVSGKQGTSVYIQGSLVMQVPFFQISASDLSGGIVLGDSRGQSDSWNGNLLGIALYHRDLAAFQILRHYQTWTEYGRPEIAGDERNDILYLFDEHAGTVVHNRAGKGFELYIPDKYTVVDQIFLEPVWREFRMSASYWGNAVKNVVGFIPVGFSFYVYFASAVRARRPAILAVIVGFLLSLTIEILQAYLPTRDSGTTDIVTNTFGTWIGAVLYRWSAPALPRFFAWLRLTGSLP